MLTLPPGVRLPIGAVILPYGRTPQHATVLALTHLLLVGRQIRTKRLNLASKLLALILLAFDKYAGKHGLFRSPQRADVIALRPARAAFRDHEKPAVHQLPQPRVHTPNADTEFRRQAALIRLGLGLNGL